MRSNTRVGYIIISIILLITLSIIFSSIAIAEEDELVIVIQDEDDYEIEGITENENFKVSVYVNVSEIPQFLIDVDIKFDGIHYQIDETAELILQAPTVDSDRTYIVTAAKEGYNSSNKALKILNKVEMTYRLESSSDVVDAGDTFAVYVYDSDDNPVSGILVGIDRIHGQTGTTDDDGRVWLKAPENLETMTIYAQKDGVIIGDLEIKVNIELPWWEILIKSMYFPIFIAMIILIIIVLYVSFRQKKSVYGRAKEIADNKAKEKYEEITLQKQNVEEQEKQYYSKDTVRAQPEKDSKVEEIRISRPRKEKEIVPVETEKDKTEKIIEKKKNQINEYDWFEGTDDIRYEIDKLTGEIDEEGIDKWYEGVDNLKEKINEKVKKKDKKKENGE